MKKVLLATSALVAAGFVTSASAAEWQTGVSGYYFLGVAVSDGAGQDGIGVLRDGEAHINGRLTADNGLTFRARIELEAFTSSDQIDENWGSVSGSFGTLMIGSNDTVGYEQLSGIGIVYAPGARIGYADSFALTTAASASGFSTTPGVPADSIGLHYSTPSIFGFQLHGTYIPQLGTDGAFDTNNPVFSGNAGPIGPGLKGPELWNLAATYTGDFGDFSFGLGGQYTDIEGVADEQWALAANVGFSGFTVAGYYQDNFGSDEFGIGGQYKTGPWSIAGGYSNADSSGNNHDIASGWVTYTAGPGVLVTVGVEYADDNGANNSDIGALAFLTLRF